VPAAELAERNLVTSAFRVDGSVAANPASGACELHDGSQAICPARCPRFAIPACHDHRVGRQDVRGWPCVAFGGYVPICIEDSSLPEFRE